MRWVVEKKKLFVVRCVGIYLFGNCGVMVSKEVEWELKEIEKMLCINGVKSVFVL